MRARKTTGRTLILFAALMLTAQDGARAAGTKPLPEFRVSALDGRTVRSSDLAADENWLLIYIEPGCRPCDGVLKVFDRAAPVADVRRRVVVVVGGRTVEETKLLAERFRWLPEACWYADPARRAAQALKAGGAPVVYGVRGDQLEWTLNGTLSDAKKLESVLLTWLESQSA